MFSKVRSGDVRILLGSTAKMGAGTNVQQRLAAVHHLDVGWKPSDMTQRNGRIIRQGNMNKEVKVFNYVTEGTFDSYLFQTLENKQRFISQIMTSKSPVRSCDDVDEQALSYAEIKALCAGNPLIKEKMDLDVQVAKLKVLKADHQSQKFRLEDKLLTKFPADIQETNAYLAGVKADAEVAAAHPQEKEGFCGIIIKGVTYNEKKTAGERLLLACSELPNSEEKVIGSYRGFELSLRFDTYHSEYQALLKGQRKYPVALGKDPLGCIIRLDNSLNNFPERITSAENELATLKQQQEAAQIEVEKPFPQEEELAEKSARLAELNAQLDMDEKGHEPEQDEEEQEDEPRRPSVLAALEEKADKTETVKPFKSFLDKDQGGNAMRLKDNNNPFIHVNPPYQLMVIHSSKLVYPRELYQRGVERKRVELIAAHFNEYVANEPKVSFRNGQFIVTDGQHTIEGRILRNGGKDLPILCKVYTGMTVEQEALLFAEQNGFSAPLTAGIRLRAKVVGGDAISKAFLAATNRVGLSLNYDSQQLTDYRIGCVGTAFRLYKQMGEPLYCETMRLIVAAWEGKPDSFRASVLKGMMHFVELYHGEFSEERLLRALRSIHPVDIYRIGQDDPAKLRGWKKYVFPIYTAYNGKCRKDALPMKF